MITNTEPYVDSVKRWPANGQHILANQTDDNILVYQAYNSAIADFAIRNQRLGGPAFSFNRMSWIKPNFMWMMYRCGWGEKENQERVLAFTISKNTFENILKKAVFSSFEPSHYSSHEQWRTELELKEVRLQWDPDHDPFGNKLDRRAIQLGLKAGALQSFIDDTIFIDDITDFVKQQKAALDRDGISQLLVPVEIVFKPADEALSLSVGIIS
jgi:hypothetical protein